MYQYRFSVVIPVYNVEDYLRCCIDSVLTALDQSCMTEAAEILLVIGQSKDRTDFLCRYYETNYQQIRVIPQNGSGLSNARNCGLAVARGAYTVFLDGDDFVDSPSFGKMLDMLGKQACEMMAFDFHMVSEDGAVDKSLICRTRRQGRPCFAIFWALHVVYGMCGDMSTAQSSCGKTN